MAPKRSKRRSVIGPGLEFVVQSPQLGTGHALLQAEPVLPGRSGTVLLVYADVPLLFQSSTLRGCWKRIGPRGRGDGADRRARGSARLRAHRPRRDGPSRADRRRTRRVGRGARVERDQQRHLRVRPRTAVRRAAPALATDNAQGEYYLTDLVAGLPAAERIGWRPWRWRTPDELRGVNSRVDLADLARALRERKNRDVMLAGVTLEDPASTSIDEDVTIGEDTIDRAGGPAGRPDDDRPALPHSRRHAAHDQRHARRRRDGARLHGDRRLDHRGRRVGRARSRIFGPAP